MRTVIGHETANKRKKFRFLDRLHRFFSRKGSEDPHEETDDTRAVDRIVKDTTQGLPSYILPDDMSYYTARRFKDMDSDPVYDTARLLIKNEDISGSNKMAFRIEDTDCNLSFDYSIPVVVSDFKKEVNVIFSRPESYYRYEYEPREYPCKCVCVADDETFDMFSNYRELEEKVEAIKTFWRLNPLQREYVKKRYSKPKYTEDDKKEGCFKPIQDKASLEMMYTICKDTYSAEDRAKLDSLFDKLDNRYGGESKADILTQISYKLCIDTDAIERKEKSYDEIMRIFDEYVYGMDELKERIAEYILAMQYANANYFSILLVGSPGVGKTSVCNAICAIMQCELANVDCSGVNYVALGGIVKTYGCAQPGKISNALIEKGKTDLILRLDEVDKLVSDKDGDAFSALNKPLGPQRLLYDEFLADDIDMSNCKIICTSNDLNKIPGYIINRFEDNVFYIPDYTAEDKAEIAKHHLIPKEMKYFKVSSDDIIFTDEAIMEVASNYCLDAGAREMSGYVKSLIRKAIKGWYRGTDKKPTVVDVDFVRKHLKLPEKKENKNPIGFGGKLCS